MSRSAAAKSEKTEPATGLHPRENAELWGHEAAERYFLHHWQQGRMPHAILLTGAKGIGKATLAYRLARFMLSGGASPPPAQEEEPPALSLFGDALPAPAQEAAASGLAISAQSPVFQRVASGHHPDLLAISPAFDAKKGDYKREIGVDDTRKVSDFLSLTASQSAWQVVIIDAADEMNDNAANALLKILEEPPANALLLLVSHNPGALLPTIRSRCRTVKLRAPEPEVFHRILSHILPDSDAPLRGALYEFSHGAPGRAVEWHEQGGLERYGALIALLSATQAGIDILAAHAFAEEAAKEGNAAWNLNRHALSFLIGKVVQRAAGTGGTRSTAPLASAEEALIERLSVRKPLDYWLELWNDSERLFSSESRLNLDKKQVILLILQGLAGNALPAPAGNAA